MTDNLINSKNLYCSVWIEIKNWIELVKMNRQPPTHRPTYLESPTSCLRLERRSYIWLISIVSVAAWDQMSWKILLSSFTPILLYFHKLPKWKAWVMSDLSAVFFLCFFSGPKDRQFVIIFGRKVWKLKIQEKFYKSTVRKSTFPHSVFSPCNSKGQVSRLPSQRDESPGWARWTWSRASGSCRCRCGRRRPQRWPARWGCWCPCGRWRRRWAGRWWCSRRSVKKKE